MKYLLYASSGIREFGPDEITDILEVSRRNNAETGVSGMLLYAEGNFIQYIEGEEQEIDALFARITKDPRHRQITVLNQGGTEERQFPDWTMGYKPLEREDLERIGRFDLSRGSLEERLTGDMPKVVVGMMRQFYRTSYGRSLD